MPNPPSSTKNRIRLSKIFNIFRRFPNDSTAKRTRTSDAALPTAFVTAGPSSSIPPCERVPSQQTETAKSESASSRFEEQKLDDGSPPRGLDTQEETPTSAAEGTPQRTVMLEAARSNTLSDKIGAAFIFTRTLLKRAPDIADGNPVKMAFALAKLVLEIGERVRDNIDAVEQRIIWTSSQLLDVQQILETWDVHTGGNKTALETFERHVGEQLAKLLQLQKQSSSLSIAVHEEDKKRISEIFNNINQARERLMLVTGLTVQRSVNVIQETLKKTLLKDLKPVGIADHKYHLEGEERQLLRRTVCTPGTRVRILESITNWVNSDSSTAEVIYWLFGSAGSGKSTIAYTIANRFDPFMNDPGHSTILGANFFCSRQFDSTRFAKRIVPTIAYQLALQSGAFAEALTRCNLDVVHQNARAQLKELLVKPWSESEAARHGSAPCLVVIDALDEIDGNGGSEFLVTLLDAIRKYRLPGLRFFVTSRPDPELVEQVDLFEHRQLYRLEEIPVDEVQDDIETYLSANLRHFAGTDLMKKLVVFTGTLFISAATIIKHLEGYQTSEQKKLLKNLLSRRPSPGTPQGPTDLLDHWYAQILKDALGGFEGEFFRNRLQILHVILCAAERTSTSIASGLVAQWPENVQSDTASTSSTASSSLDLGVANDVVNRLYAVLYIEEGKVLTYHKSFPDFILDQARPGRYWCHEPDIHRRLANSCFRVMEVGLRFNIANIPSSFYLDDANPTLLTEVEQTISPILRYSCRHWQHHLSSMSFSKQGGPESLFNSLSDFLQFRALFWIESMNLIGSRGLCEPMLREASRSTSEYDAVTSRALAEAANFALYFAGSPAASSTPHLYLSSLATWPRNQYPCSEWRKQFPGIPAFTSQANRAITLMTLEIQDWVNAVAVPADGRQIVTGSGDGLVRVWDASTGIVLGVLQGHAGPVTSVAVPMDGMRVVSGGDDDKMARVWEVASGKLLHVLEGHTAGIRAVAFSNDGSHVATASSDNTVRIWDPLTGACLWVLEGHAKHAYSVAFSNDGKWLASGSEDHSVRIWNLSKGSVLRVLEGHSGIVGSVKWSMDGSRIVSSSDDKTVRIWDFTTGETLGVLEGHLAEVRSVAISPDGYRIASGCKDTRIRIWDASTCALVDVLHGHSNNAVSVTFSWDGSRLISGSIDGSARVWDASFDGSPKEPSANSNVQGTTPGLGNSDTVYSVAFSPDDTCVVSASALGSIRIWDASTGSLLNTLSGHTDRVMCVCFSDDGRWIGSGSRDNTVGLWDATTGERLRTWEGHESRVASVVIARDGQKVASASNDSTIRLWDTESGELLGVLKGHTRGIQRVAFSDDGTLLASASYDKRIFIWDVSSKEKIRELNEHTDAVIAVAFFNNDTYLVSGSFDASVRIWLVATGEVYRVLEPGHTLPVYPVAHIPHSSRVVSGSLDRSVRVWDVERGQLLDVLEGHTRGVLSLESSHDGTRLVSGGDDDSVRVWDLSESSRSSRPYSVQRVLNDAGIAHRTGWILSSDGKGDLLMFTPSEAMLPDPSNVLVIPPSASSSVDFTKAYFGSEWDQCYRPIL